MESLSLFAEIAVGLAGFGGVAVMLGRGPGRWGAGDALRIRLLLTAAFSALFASLTATGSHWAGAGEASSVRLGSAVLLVGQVYWGAFLGPQVARLETSERALFNTRIAIALRCGAYSSWMAQLFVLSGFSGLAAPWLFLYGLLLCLGYAAFGFVRLLFVRPGSE
jgi:hypothetical protein